MGAGAVGWRRGCWGGAGSPHLCDTARGQVEGSDNKMKFAETFQLVITDGGYYLHNDIYRLNLM